MRTILMSLLLLFAVFGAKAQNCQSSLKGTLTDKNTGQPIISGKIQIQGTNKITYSDLDGNFQFNQLCDGTIQVEFSAENTDIQVFTITIGGPTRMDVVLDRHPVELTTVTLIGHSYVRKSATAQEQFISEKEIDRYSAQSLGDALRQMSGVSTLKTGKSIVKPVIQGLTGSRVPVLNNGVKMEDQEWGAEHAPNIDLNSAGKLTVIKGAAALQYGGGAIGGVVIAEKPSIPIKDTLFGKTILSGSVNGRGGSVTTSLIKSYKSGWYAGVQGTLKKFGDYKVPGYYLNNTGSNERNFSLNTGWQKHDYGFDLYYSKFNNHLGILRASSTGSVSDLVNAINNKEPVYQKGFSYDLESPFQKVDHQLAKAGAYYYFDGLGKLSASYSYQNNDRKEYDIRRGENKTIPSIDLNLQTHAWDAVFDIRPVNDYRFKLGIDGSRKSNFSNPETGVQRLIPDYKSLNSGVFVTGNYKINNQWLVEAGIRYDYFRILAKKYYNKVRWYEQGYHELFADLIIGDYGSQYLVKPDFEYHNISATAGARYSLGSGLDFRINYAASNRAPNPAELFSDGLHQSSASLEIGDLSLASEHSHNISFSVEKNTGNLSFTVSPYYNYIHNFIDVEPKGLEETIRGVFLRYAYRQRDARLLGLDIDVNYQFDEYFSWHGKFNTVDGRDTNSKRALLDIPATNMVHSWTYHHEDWNDLAITLNGDWTFKKQNYPNDNFEIQVLEDGQYHTKIVDISTPPKAYFLTGLDAEMTFQLYKNGVMNVRLSLDNIFNVKHRDYLNRLKYFADNTGRNISLTLRFNY